MKKLLFTLFVFLTVAAQAQLDVQIKLGDRNACSNSTLLFIDSIVSGSPTSYEWISSVATFSTISGFITEASFSASGNVILKTQDAFTTFYDTVYVTLNAPPAVEVGSNESICCDYGDISLDLKVVTLNGSGVWSCPNNPRLIVNNIFSSDSACGLISAPVSSIASSLIFTYQDSITQCINSDTMVVTVNALPRTFLSEQEYCQDIGAISLADDVVVSPANTSLGTFAWRCLDSNAVSNNYTLDILENRGSSFAPDWWLNLGEDVYTIQNTNKDTIILELTYTNLHGCTTKDSVKLILNRVPKLKFTKMRDLCWDEGEISLNQLTGVYFPDARWTVYDSTGFNTSTELGTINGDTLNTLNSLPSGGTYVIRCVSNTKISTGCPAVNDTTITIHPLPILNLTELTPNRFCETSVDMKLQANPIGGTWSSNDLEVLVSGTDFSPGMATRFFPSTIRLQYDYTSPVTGCSANDSIEALVDASPIIHLPDDTTLCRRDGVTSLTLNKQIKAENTDQINWFNFNQMTKINLGTVAIGDITLSFDSMLRDTFRIIVNAVGQGSCADIDGIFDIIVHHESNCILSVDELFMNAGSVYPNPTKGTIHIDKHFELISCLNAFGQSVEAGNLGGDAYFISTLGFHTLLLKDKKTGALNYKKVMVE
ncbi:hypothetical protein OAD66_00050 [Bacteroidia bacterium]|nr:hypothetical protein [Bacteroidia bacterium]MDB9881519.1 hypothetical protein [Bacteroidia bacterium]